MRNKLPPVHFSLDAQLFTNCVQLLCRSLVMLARRLYGCDKLMDRDRQPRQLCGRRVQRGWVDNASPSNQHIDRPYERQHPRVFWPLRPPMTQGLLSTGIKT